MGKFYDFKGPDATIDPKKAMDWYLKAAKQNIPEAYIRIGNMIREGRGVKKDLNKALGWYQKAAELGHPDGNAKVHLLKLQILNSQQ